MKRRKCLLGKQGQRLLQARSRNLRKCQCHGLLATSNPSRQASLVVSPGPPRPPSSAPTARDFSAAGIFNLHSLSHFLFIFSCVFVLAQRRNYRNEYVRNVIRGLSQHFRVEQSHFCSKKIFFRCPEEKIGSKFENWFVSR